MQQAIEDLLNITLTTVQRIEITSNRIADKPGTSILRSVLTEDTDRIKTTLAEIDETDFEHAIDSLLAADRIYIVEGRSAASLEDRLQPPLVQYSHYKLIAKR